MGEGEGGPHSKLPAAAAVGAVVAAISPAAIPAAVVPAVAAHTLLSWLPVLVVLPPLLLWPPLVLHACPPSANVCTHHSLCSPFTFVCAHSPLFPLVCAHSVVLGELVPAT